jgi:predicted nucleic acid-binding protein
VILADTSAWIEFDHASGSRVDRRLVELIESGADLAVTEPVLMELTAGARTDEREQDLRRMLSAFRLLRVDPISDFDGATRIYGSCRRSGVTPRGLLDCLIAAVAHRHGAALLCRDRDLVRIAGIAGIEIDPASS